MQFRNVNQEMLEKALARVNEKFADNIKFYEPPVKKGNIWNLRLTVVKTGAPGTKISRFMGRDRRVHAACWHVHGEFFRALPLTRNMSILAPMPPMPQYKTAFTKQYKTAFTKVWRDCDAPWLDPNVGSLMYPVNASECCDCE